MRVSLGLYLNSTISKSCVQRKKENWFLQNEKADFDKTCGKNGLSCSGSSKAAKDLVSRPDHKSDQQEVFASRITHLPSFLSACCEVKWFIDSRRTASQVVSSAFKQICSLSAVLLVCATLLVLSAQVAGLLFMLSYATSLPVGLLFMLCSACFISSIVFKIMRVS